MNCTEGPKRCVEVVASPGAEAAVCWYLVAGNKDEAVCV